MVNKTIISVILLLFCVSIAHAAVVTLKSGKKINGKIIERTDKYIKMDIGGSEVYYENKYVKDIIEEDAQKSAESSEITAGPKDNFLKQGLKLASEGKFDLAESQFNKGLAANKDDYNILSAQDLLSQLKEGKVTEEFVKYLFQGSYNMIDENYPAAIEALKKAHEIKSDDLDIAYNLGVAYYSINEFDKAIEYLKKVVSNRPKDGMAYSYLGSSCMSLGKAQEAENNFTEAKKLFEESGDAENASEMRKILAKILLTSSPQ